MKNYNFRMEVTLHNGMKKTSFIHRLDDVDKRCSDIARKEEFPLKESKVFPLTRFAKRILRVDYLTITDAGYQFFLKGEKVSFF